MSANEDFEKFTQKYSDKKKQTSSKPWEYYCKLSIETLSKEFSDWYSQNKGFKSTALKKACKVRLFFRDTGLTLKEVTPEYREAHKALLLEMIEKKQRKKNYVSTILNDLNVFFCHFLKRDDLRVAGIGKEESGYSDDRLTREEYDRMIEAVENDVDISVKKRKLNKALLVFLWNATPRTCEGSENLRYGDVRLVQREVRLRSGKRDKVPKKFQTPPLTQELIDAIEEYLPYRDSDDKSEDSPFFVQVNSGGRKVSTKYLQRLVKKYAVLAGIEKRVFPYLFRKSAGTLIGMENLKLAQLQLGHTTPVTTTKHYMIPNKEDKRRIEDYLNPNRQVTPQEITKELVKKYLQCDAMGDEELLFALKALKNVSDKENKRGDYDLAIA